MERCDATLRDNRHSDGGIRIRRDIDSFFIPQIVFFPYSRPKHGCGFGIAEPTKVDVDPISSWLVAGGVAACAWAGVAHEIFLSAEEVD